MDLLNEIAKLMKKIEWAPLNLPRRRRMQTFAAGFYVFLVILCYISFFSALYALLYFDYIKRVIVLLYLTYIYFDQKIRPAAINGNGCKLWRSNCIANHCRDYFPIELVKTAELTPDRNYLVASFPHGMIGTGITMNMCFGLTKWEELFPGIRPKIATLDLVFCLPIIGVLLRFAGAVSCSKKSLLQYLNKSNDPEHKDNRDGFTSNAVAVLVGGAQESLDTRPGHYILTLKDRKGFVKIAIRSGSPIVPSFSFGEVDIYDQLPNPPNSLLRKFQTFVKNLIGTAPVIILGRGFFQYTFGILPQRRHIVQVLGAPIEVKKMEEPSSAYVNEIHQKVIDSLNEMFEKYKHKYIENAEKTNLVIN